MGRPGGASLVSRPNYAAGTLVLDAHPKLDFARPCGSRWLAELRRSQIADGTDPVSMVGQVEHLAENLEPHALQREGSGDAHVGLPERIAAPGIAPGVGRTVGEVGVPIAIDPGGDVERQARPRGQYAGEVEGKGQINRAIRRGGWAGVFDP